MAKIRLLIASLVDSLNVKIGIAAYNTIVILRMCRTVKIGIYRKKPYER